MAALSLRRGLVWPVALAAVSLFVAIDFVQHPFRGSTQAGNAAERRSRLAIVIPGSELGGPSSSVVRLLVAAARREGLQIDAARQRGGATAAVESVIGVGPGARQRLLAVSAETLVQLGQDRRETLIPGVAERAERAWRRLAAARPLALLAVDPAAVAVAGRSPLRSFADLGSELRGGKLVVGVGQDLWSRALLASLVAGSGVDGRVPYRAFSGSSEAAAATSSHDARVVLGPRSALTRRPGTVRILHGDWPAGPRPLQWVALVAPVAANGPAADRLAAVAQRPAWRRALRRHGLRPVTAGPAATRRFLAAERARASTLVRDLIRVRARSAR
ncbi:hypothetical protein [Patulibacter medicamentivorans]|uniref:hypothetical protein n=1 Tax=Patulibacter medicamentivorans TaxID=1097667 RepID=UPI00058EA4F9|nr:hypothetical protein [Patulibacter medicamentivorans]